MNNIVYLHNDPILLELDSSVDKKAGKKMIAFKYFNGDERLLNEYLKDNDYNDCNSTFKDFYIEPKSQLEFSF
tara:strand:- start:4729 stop:4947 length:219 start_codon:yes stop_codon:yes gene_type:complete